jgi:uncharacterized membrane protein
MMWTSAPWWHWLGMAGFWVVILLVALWAATRLFPSTETRPRTPRSILDERLARGEIDVSTYRRLLDVLLQADRPYEA